MWLGVRNRLVQWTGSRCWLCAGRRRSVVQMFCDGCRADLPWLTSACWRCALPLKPASAAFQFCGRCLANPPPYQKTVCLFHYAYPVDRLVTGLKFQQQLVVGELLGGLLAQRMAQERDTGQSPQALLPMPLHPRRLRQRGYNQAFELARVCARNLGLPLLADSCVRVKDTAAQSGLSAHQRRRNLAGAFRVNQAIPYQRIAIVDDVVTTGASARALAQTLANANIAHLEVWSIARTGTDSCVQ